MELIKPGININFVGMRFKACILSCTLILLGVAVLFWRGGLNLGVDFAGGTLIQVQFKQSTTPEDIRKALKDQIARSTIQEIGSGENEFLIRTEVITTGLQSFAQEIQQNLDAVYGKDNVSVRRVEMVGPKVGHDLRQKALFAIYYALLFIAIYISGRFEFKWMSSAIMAALLMVGIYLLQAAGVSVTYLIAGALIITLGLCWKLKLPYALGAVLALVHDVLITVGVFALVNKEFTLEILAALLTLVGFSLNDTIIVFDRIRENLKKSRRQDLAVVINTSINQTLSRTILTSGTVLVVVLSLFLWGGSVIHDFAFALLVGIITGTYSSIYVASPVLLLYEDWTRGKARAAKPVAKSV
ncbi:protein translocase subunit SecF [Desulfoferrobacter suflitae]|uniref:protein translocase subunit SecF n=1 Tax=Desulfoferrobacter suflitae TaxID=2865782 RepID=UPI00216408C8|nr:protein translocase subunit SecF [Desulfoferrobacter suflitae]MCK8602359.1 protein translocase subunit SecF [Desulfoferrobacter suflitae]